MFKGLTLSFFIIAFLLVGVPMITAAALIGTEDYARQCKMTPLMPCFGLSE